MSDGLVGIDPVGARELAATLRGAALTGAAAAVITAEAVAALTAASSRRSRRVIGSSSFV